MVWAVIYGLVGIPAREQERRSFAAVVTPTRLLYSQMLYIFGCCCPTFVRYETPIAGALACSVEVAYPVFNSRTIVHRADAATRCAFNLTEIEKIEVVPSCCCGPTVHVWTTDAPPQPPSTGAPSQSSGEQAREQPIRPPKGGCPCCPTPYYEVNCLNDPNGFCDAALRAKQAAANNDRGGMAKY